MGRHENKSTEALKFYPFCSGSAICQGISAALQSKLCTYSVTGTLNAQQPTYIMENPGLKYVLP